MDSARRSDGHSSVEAAPTPLQATGEDWALLGKGKSSQVFGTGHGEVVKIFHDAVSEEMIQREMKAARLAASHGLPTAAPTTRIRVQQQSALVYPEIVGPSMSAAIRKQPFAAAALLDRMAQLHRAVHDREADGLRTVKSVLQTDIDYGPAPAQLKQAAAAYLGTLPDSARLLHGDFHIDNIIVGNDGLVILDWAKAATGDPAADVVRSEMLMLYGEGPSDPIMNIWRGWAAHRLIKAYQRRNGMTDAQLSLWRPVVALAWLRARPAVRTRAFHAYLNRALRKAGLPEFAP